MVSPDIIDTEGNRLLETYFDINKIKKSNNPYKEFLRQINRMKQFGIIQQLKQNYTMANKLFKMINLPKTIKGKSIPTPLKRKEFKSFNFGTPQQDLKASLKGATTRTGTRIVTSHYKGIIKAFELWKNKKTAIEVKRNKLGQFA